MQALFLDEAFCAEFAKLALPASWPSSQIEWGIARVRRYVSSPESPSGKDYYKYERDQLRTMIAWKDGKIKGSTKLKVRFESGVDIHIAVTYLIQDEEFAETTLRVEIKPTVGDDFPTVLWQMKHEKADTLFISEYVGEGVTREQFVKIFNNEGIRVVFRSSVAS